MNRGARASGVSNDDLITWIRSEHLPYRIGPSEEMLSYQSVPGRLYLAVTCCAEIIGMQREKILSLMGMCRPRLRAHLIRRPWRRERLRHYDITTSVIRRQGAQDFQNLILSTYGPNWVNELVYREMSFLMHHITLISSCLSQRPEEYGTVIPG